MTERINQYIEISKIHGNKKINSIVLILYKNMMKVGIIGGGASGMMSAILLSRE